MEKLNQWFAIVGNLGVIAGIIFLVFEVQTNTSAIRSASYQAFNDASFSWADSEIENAAALAKIHEKPNWEDLTAEEQILLGRILFKAFAVMESNYLHFRTGAMEEDLFEARLSGTISAMKRYPLWFQYYQRSNNVLLPEFRNFLDAKFELAESSKE